MQVLGNNLIMLLPYSREVGQPKLSLSIIKVLVKSLLSRVGQLSIELGANEVNQINAVPDKDKGNSLTLCTSVIPVSLI
jgi:hypothetical protein